MAIKFNVNISPSTIIFLILNIFIFIALVFVAYQITELKNSISHQKQILHGLHQQIEHHDQLQDGFLPKKGSKFLKPSKFPGTELKHKDSKMKPLNNNPENLNSKDRSNRKHNNIEFHKEKTTNID